MKSVNETFAENVSSSLRLFSLEWRLPNGRRERPKMTFAEPRPLSVLRQDDQNLYLQNWKGLGFI